MLCLTRGSHARAHLAAGSHDVIPLSGNDPACHTRGRAYDPQTVHDSFSFLLYFSLFDFEGLTD